MPFARFIGFSISGGVFWVLLMTGAGYFFGGLAVVKGHFDVVVIAIVAISLIPVVVQSIQSRRRPAVENIGTGNSTLRKLRRAPIFQSDSSPPASTLETAEKCNFNLYNLCDLCAVPLAYSRRRLIVAYSFFLWPKRRPFQARRLPGNPHIRFAFCTACPAAPLPRLSIAASRDHRPAERRRRIRHKRQIRSRRPFRMRRLVHHPHKWPARM